MPVVEFVLSHQIVLGLLIASVPFVPWNRRRARFPLRLAAGVLLLFLITDRLSLDNMLWLLVCAVCIGLLILTCFDCSVIHAVFSSTCAYTVQHITSKLTYLLLMPLMLRSDMTVELFEVVLLLLLVNLLVCVPIFLLFTRRFLKEGKLRFDRVRTVLLSGAFLFVAIFLSSVMERNLDSAAPTYLSSYLALNAFCVLFACSILSMEFANCRIKRLESEKSILEQLLENDRQQYEQAKRDMEKINIRYHDLKQQYSHAIDREERARLEAEMHSLNLRYFTGDKAVDIVLTQKSRICESERIQFICSVDGGCLSGVKHYHIYSLLGNAIDNAIECLSRVDDETKRIIDLDVSRRGDMAVIRIENYTPAQPVLQNGVLATTKPDAEGHGYGVKSIRNIAALYGGTADFFVEDHVFCLLVTLPCAGAGNPSAPAA